jgi:hypothetical protein
MFDSHVALQRKLLQGSDEDREEQYMRGEGRGVMRAIEVQRNRM